MASLPHNALDRVQFNIFTFCRVGRESADASGNVIAQSLVRAAISESLFVFLL